MQSLKESTRRAIIDHARRVFASKGYSGTSMLDIAHECGVGVGTIYNYFGNKRALFDRVVAPGREAFTQLSVCDEPETFYKMVSHCRSELRLMLFLAPDDYSVENHNMGNITGLSVNVCHYWLHRLLESLLRHRPTKTLALDEITEYIAARRALASVVNE